MEGLDDKSVMESEQEVEETEIYIKDFDKMSDEEFIKVSGDELDLSETKKIGSIGQNRQGKREIITVVWKV